MLNACLHARATLKVSQPFTHPLMLAIKTKNRARRTYTGKQVKERQSASFARGLLFPLALRSSANQRTVLSTLRIGRFLNREIFFKNKTKEGR